MKKRNIALVVAVCSVVAIVAAGTYAFWIWTSNVNKNVVFNVDSGLSKYIVYDEGDSSFVGNFQPTDYFCDSISTTISFYKTSAAEDVGFVATINMDINDIGSNTSNSTDVYWIVTKGDSSIACDDGLDSSSIVSYGNFGGAASGESIVLKDNLEVKMTQQDFTIWIWMDASGASLSDYSGEIIDVNVWTEINMLKVSPADPVLDDGMIPVTISDDGTVTTISEDDDSWYNYATKKWANVVLVSSSSRGNYVDTSGVIVSSSDILAYYVWIPRYKYKILTSLASTGTGGNEQTIDIVFENVDAPRATGTTVGSYLTHPAFWWDNNNNSVVDSGEMLAGIWVGKFETTGSSTTPTILPNSSSIVGQIVSEQFISSLKFSGGTLSSGSVSFVGNDTYGLANATDSHMMKNSEWGAVTYLSHSNYGINDNVSANNGSVTGYGTSSYGATSEYPQSTTGNISGIFDMSGYNAEVMMANYNNESGYDYECHSGFNGILSDEEYSEGIDFPPLKYYDSYSSYNGLTACGGSVCNGHALNETLSWYNTYGQFFKSVNPWLSRGYYDNPNWEYSTRTISYGLFNYANYAGCGGGDEEVEYTWRSVLVIK